MINILAVINTYNLPSLLPFFIDNLNGWSNQILPDDYHLDIVISDESSSDLFRQELEIDLKKRTTDNKRFFSIYHNNHNTVHITFNLAIQYFKAMNNFTYFIFCSDDCMMINNKDLSTLLSVFQHSTDIGQVTALVNRDNAAKWYPKYSGFEKDSLPVYVSLGEAVNIHLSIYSKFFMEKYDYKYIDVLTAWATESVGTFLHAAIGTRWAHCKSVQLKHPKNVKPIQKGYSGYNTYKNFRSIESIFEGGVQLGLGFECWMNLPELHSTKENRKKMLKWDKYKFCHMFNKKVYSKTGECKNKEKLYNYIKENLFLPKNIFDYDEAIKNVVVGGK